MSEPKKPAWEVKSTDFAFNLIKGLDGSVKQSLQKAFNDKLEVDPEGYGTSLRAPLTGYIKYEFFRHRVVYRAYADLRLVVVCFVGIRKKGDNEDVYNQLSPLIKAGRLADQIGAVLKAAPKTGFKSKEHPSKQHKKKRKR
jgi:mRNA-degrading endonuclease RelE of RelBE toxin-antitoxin system